MQQQGEGRAEIYTYESPHLVYAAGWSVSAAGALLAKPGVVSCACACLPLRSTCLHRLQLCSMLCLLPGGAADPPRLASKHCMPPALPMWLQVRPDKPFRLALGSFIEDYANRVEIVQRELLVQPLPLPPQQRQGAAAAAEAASSRLLSGHHLRGPAANGSSPEQAMLDGGLPPAGLSWWPAVVVPAVLLQLLSRL